MPVLDVFFTMLVFFLWVAWIWLVISVFIDIFRSGDLGGWGKAGWSVLVLLVPFLGVLIYLIVRSDAFQPPPSPKTSSQACPHCQKTVADSFAYCPHCGESENVRRMEGKSHRPGLFQCNSCRKTFTVTDASRFTRLRIHLFSRCSPASAPGSRRRVALSKWGRRNREAFQILLAKC